jgi:cell division protease FtsH
MQIDSEIKRIVSQNYNKAANLLKSNINILHKLAEMLLQQEVVDSKELDSLVKGFEASNNLFGETVST